MKKMSSVVLALAIAMLPGWPLLAEDLETDWIEPVEGYQEGTIGARLNVLDISPVDGSTTVTIAIPKSSMEDSESVEEIIVYGKKPDKSEPVIAVPHKWVKDYSNDYYGLVLYLGKEGNIPLRLYFKGHESP